MLSINKSLEQNNHQEKYSIFVADDDYTNNICYKFRHDVFLKEMGPHANFSNNIINIDKFDKHGHNLVIFDNRTNEIIGTTRLFDNNGRKKTGMFYSETKFDLSNILNLEINFIEIGKTCIHPAYKRDTITALLWRGIADFVVAKKIDYLIGYTSIPLRNGDIYVNSIMKQIFNHHYTPDCLRVNPYIPFRLNEHLHCDEKIVLPSLLKNYIRQGALVCGEPYLDASHGFADLFVLLETSNINS